MGKYVIQTEIDEEALLKEFERIVNQILSRQMSEETLKERGVMKQAIKEIVYSHKDEIVERVVNKATAEIVRKGMPRLLEKWAERKDE